MLVERRHQNNNSMKKNNNLSSYLTIAVGLGCISSTNAASVIFYGINSPNDISANPTDIDINYDIVGYNFVIAKGATAVIAQGQSDSYFTNGTDLDNIAGPGSYGGYYLYNGSLDFGATQGPNNYANLSFDGDDGVYEAVGQFSFDGNGGGFLIAIAFADGTTLACLLYTSPSPRD